MEGKSGLKPTQQAILFKGKQLSSTEDLLAAGVAEGDTLNIVPTKGDAPRAPPPSRPRSPLPTDSDLASSAGASAASAAAAAAAGPSTPDELLSMLNGMLGNSGLGESPTPPSLPPFLPPHLTTIPPATSLSPPLPPLPPLSIPPRPSLPPSLPPFLPPSPPLGGLAGAGSPEDAAKMFQGMDMGKVAKMYQAFIWKLVRSPIVARYLSSEEDMEMLRMKLKESFENVSQDPKVAAQMAPFLNDDFRAMMEDTQKFRDVGFLYSF